MKIAIEQLNGSFSERFVTYCREHGIEYQIVDSAANDFIEKIRDFDVFLWHPYQGNWAHMQYGKSLTLTLEKMGIKVFPDSATFYHFDDKIAETRLLQAVQAPVVPSYIFYRRKDALEWAKHACYPKVFKLKGGAGSINVRLVRTEREAQKLIGQMFRFGVDGYGRFSNFKDVAKKFFHHRATLRSVLSCFKRYLMHLFAFSFTPTEYGYAYFQDFIPDNPCDFRVIVIGNKAFSIQRLCRSNDFRASGSGNIVFAHEQQNEACVAVAFETAKKLGTQCLAFDFVLEKGKPLIVEISFGFAMRAYDLCDGYWTDDMVWHPGKFIPQYWIMDNILKMSPGNVGRGK